MNLYRYISMILGFPKTIYINFKYFNFNVAIRLPIIVSHKVFLRKCHGIIKINSPIKTGMIKIGFEGAGTFDERKMRSIIEINGNIVFNGSFILDSGSKMAVMKEGCLSIGNNVHIGVNTSIICAKHISIGDNSIISWENLIIDTDFHKLMDSKNNILNKDNPIIIGKNVWIGYRCTISKGSRIGNNTVIACNTHLHNKIEQDNVVIGGNPIKVLKEDIHWSI